MERKLAAIMFTDIVGYTALMDRDEVKAFELLRKNRTIQKPLIEQYSGQFLKEMGDGILASFKTVTDAVYCAGAIQLACAREDDLTLRIGLHQGEVVFDGEDVFGSGVNIASRIEALAPSGATWASEAIHKNISNKPGIESGFIREETLKNVKEPVKIYELKVDHVLTEPVTGAPNQAPEGTDISEAAPTSLWETLKQRDVFKAGIVYLVVAWLLLQIGETAVGNFDLPSWFLTGLRILLIVGFPIAVALAWYYERSPDGFIRTGTQKSRNNPFTSIQKKPLTGNVMIGIMVLVVLVIYLSPKSEVQDVSQSPEIAASEIALPAKSVAVIPFKNLSDDRSNEYFSDGVMEAILNHLSKIGELKVISRTSVERYRETTQSTKEIARELEVGNILEGSVQKYGNKVRVTVQLINGKTDEHLWSENYDRDLDGIFSIQSEIARAVATALEAELTPKQTELINNAPTSNVTAYDFALKAREIYVKTENDLDNVFELNSRAVQEDPKFADAYAGMAWALYGKKDYGKRERIWKDSALMLINKALELDPDLPSAYNTRANIRYSVYDYDGYVEDLNRIIELDPNNSDALRKLGNYELQIKNYENAADLLLASISRQRFDQTEAEYFNFAGRIFWSYLGNLDEAEKQFQEAVRLRPYDVFAYGRLYGLASRQGKDEQALKYAEKLISIAPDNDFYMGQMGITHTRLGNYAKAEEYYRRRLEMMKDYEQTYGSAEFIHRLGFVLVKQGRTEEGMEILEKRKLELLEATQRDQRIKDYIGEYYDLACIYAFQGKKDEAYRWLLEARDKEPQGAFFASEYLFQDPALDNLRSDDRFKQILKDKLAEEELQSRIFREKMAQYKAEGELRWLMSN